ncbi:reticulon-1 isoform X1 [Nylanderia fulva]|uniref:reticulon-1 isoform X1 n=1 Tax=Nylanderia fulva TaxID=613905 RepID=UPI0010FB0D33|nr:reticulon-1 isoform X1 [Nylanderia fulva]
MDPERIQSDDLKRDHDSVDDFEHLGHDGSPDDRSDHYHHQQQPLRLIDAPRVDDLLHIGDSFQGSDPVLPSALVDVETKPVPATPPPSADFDKCEAMAQSSDIFQRPLDPVDPKFASMAFVETERTYPPPAHQFRDDDDDDDHDNDNEDEDEDSKKLGLQVPLLPSSTATADDLLFSSTTKSESESQPFEEREDILNLGIDQGKWTHRQDEAIDFEEEPLRGGDVRSSVLPTAERSPVLDFLGDDDPPSVKENLARNIMDDDSWNVVEKTDVKREQAGKDLEPPTKPLPPLPKEAEFEDTPSARQDKYEMSNDFLITEAVSKPSAPQPQPQPRIAADSEHESIGVKRREVPRPKEPEFKPRRPLDNKKQEIEIAPKEIFRDMGLDAWFNPERLNPKVAALIYWRDPKKSGIVFGTILGVLLSLAYFSLISVLAYLSLLVLSGTVLFRIYKTVLQAVQKTSDGHPFKDILDLDLAVPAEKVHEVADVAVAHANAAVSELRRLFLVEDFVDSLKFGVLLWCLTYVGSWFNGMTLIIIGVVALFTLPKVYETNQEQIDQNLALVQAKINEITAKVKAAIPLGKKAEPTKEE